MVHLIYFMKKFLYFYTSHEDAKIEDFALVSSQGYFLRNLVGQQLQESVFFGRKIIVSVMWASKMAS